ncbi:MAG TPA: amidase [Polyangia bacterium]|nr:amidase [Polyangia bacterium]
MLGPDLLYLSVRELGERIRSRALSPVALTEAYLERSRRVGEKLGAYAALLRTRALDEARAAEREIKAGHYRGPLHGIPYAAKDLVAARGGPTAWGAKPLAKQHFPDDATVIAKLRDAGAILLGKAAMIELAGGMGYRFASASVTGAARNPWQQGCWTCGSSSGSAAVVAAGLAGFAIGSETWGSIVCPSAFCGVSGLRPTYGRVSRHGAMALAYSLDKLGPMARTADDCALVLAGMAGHDARDPTSLPPERASFDAAQMAARPLSALRIGWLDRQWQKTAPGVASAVTAARAALEKAGARMQPALLPDGPWEAAAGVIIAAEGFSAFEGFIRSGRVAQLVDPLGRLGGYVAGETSADDLLRAQRLRELLRRKMAALYERVDLLACASLPVTATRLEANLEQALDFPDPLGGIGNLCGLPAISVPCGFADGLPVGLQLVGPPLSEASVLAVAHAFQQATDWHRRRPPLD